MLDATHCSEAGLPSTAVVTAPFSGLARLTAKGAGLPGFAFVVAEHPVWTRNDAWIDAAGKALAGEIAIILSGASTSAVLKSGESK